MTGKQIKNYQLEELLGEGGMGVVYRARDLNLDRMVAIKMLHPEMLHQPDLLKRFKNEAHVTARLSHPNIATLYNFFSEGDLHCLVMEYVNGKTMEQVLDIHKKISEEECIRVLMQLLEGLAEAHENEVLHRDIKPGNIMINRAGYVKLMDFGVARFESSARITRMNRVIGTLEYMAPELLTGGKPSKQSDLYSVGVAAFEMIYGRLPFESGSDTDMMELIMKGKVSFPSEGKQSLFNRHSKLKAIIRKLMHKKASKRYQNCGEVLDDLAGLDVNGRVSAALLSGDVLQRKSITEKTRSGTGFTAQVEAVLSWAKTLAAPLKPLLKKAKPHADHIVPKVSMFFKTTEGKIIGGAILFAVLILLFANLFSSSPDGDIDPQNNTISEHIEQADAPGRLAQSNSRTHTSINPGLAEGRSAIREGGGDYSAPPEIVIPGQNQGGQTSGSGQGQASSGETGADSGGSSPNSSGENGSNQVSDNRNRSGESENRTSSSDGEEVNDETGNSREDVSSSSQRQIQVQLSNLVLEGVFSETVSTATHKEGQQFYLITTRDVYADGYRVINAGARIRGVVNEVRTRGNSRRATLAVQFEAVQAVDGSWLPITYPEYSDRGTGSVVFERGRAISRLRIESGRVTLHI